MTNVIYKQVSLKQHMQRTKEKHGLSLGPCMNFPTIVNSIAAAGGPDNGTDFGDRQAV